MVNFKLQSTSSTSNASLSPTQLPRLALQASQQPSHTLLSSDGPSPAASSSSLRSQHDLPTPSSQPPSLLQTTGSTPTPSFLALSLPQPRKNTHVAPMRRPPSHTTVTPASPNPIAAPR
ncbi:hypothetical protein BLNAU_15547 [Blattamonas nauphoetae]|uniref:Uncharacterized protein n=1 Tax=Blattamonas nauphoetae TaxID=2049346 RepID=A0ABQ9XDW5_9EUKA|nr:hypothetical protein BLNAU_15547 [Blattamonas nauphoetae]